MLSISQTQVSDRSVTLKLEGRLAGPWVEELRQVGERVLNGMRTLKLDLGDVWFVDADGAVALRGFESRGVELTNRSAFVERQIKALA